MASNGNQDEDTFNILIATDCHLGYMERDAVRGSDSITTFEEILNIGLERNVDFILLGGDLFHENKPSRKIMHQCMYLLRKYCMGDKPVQFEFLSDQSENFKHSSFPVVNYEDPNLNISLPVFSIHGNHDDPAGAGSYCALDLLSISGLINYFGKYVDYDNIQISPLLMQKGKTKLALYGLGAIRDERLHRLFREGKVSMLRPRDKVEEWFNVFVLHQNRAKHGPSNYIPAQFLDDFLDLIIWGHEHECIIKEEWNSQQSFHVVQPGSSIATSLCQGESVKKHVGLLQIQRRNDENKFKIIEIPLKTVRQFYIADIDIDEISINMNDANSSEKVMDYCRERVESFLRKAKIERSGHPKQPEKPLIRLRIFYSENFETFSIQRFGQSYVDKVANSKDIISFTRKKKEKLKTNAIDAETLKTVLHQAGFDKSRVEDLVKQYFNSIQDSDKKMSLLSETGVGNAIKEYVDKEVNEAISVLVNHQLKKVQTHLKSQDIEATTIDDEIQKFKEDRQKHPTQELDEFHNELKSAARQTNDIKLFESSTRNNSFFDDDDTTMEINVPKRGRGRARARGPRGGGRSRGTNRSAGSSLFNGGSDASSSVQRRDAAKSSRQSTNKTTDRYVLQTGKQSANQKSKQNVNHTYSSSNSNMYSDEDYIDISDDDDVMVVSKNKKATKAAPKRGITYESDSGDSF